MATPGQASVCFSCGQPLPVEAPKTTATPASPSFILSGSSGTFKVSAGGDILVGRDPAKCAIHLVEPRVSGHHATMKVESGGLWVRDERSNNGVWINGERIPTATWTPVPANAAMRFGPIQFSVQTAT
jgi:pSer/pThr/pTyr-binding forkhead associated (FHA) protein